MDNETTARGTLDGAAAAFGVSAAIAILFNMLLAWVKDAVEPLNNAMAALTGHHWITHGLLNLLVFLVGGIVLMRRGVRITGAQLAVVIAVAAVVGGGGLGLWFVLF
jgi:hypothetical protein